MKKFIDEQGLSTLWNNIKTYVNQNGGSGSDSNCIIRYDGLANDLMQLLQGAPMIDRNLTSSERSLFSQFIFNDKLTAIYCQIPNVTDAVLHKSWCINDGSSMSIIFSTYVLNTMIDMAVTLYSSGTSGVIEIKTHELATPTMLRCDSIAADALALYDSGNTISRQLTADEFDIFKQFILNDKINAVYGQAADYNADVIFYKQVIIPEPGEGMQGVLFDMVYAGSHVTLIIIFPLPLDGTDTAILMMDITDDENYDDTWIVSNFTDVWSRLSTLESSMQTVESDISDLEADVALLKQNGGGSGSGETNVLRLDSVAYNLLMLINSNQTEIIRDASIEEQTFFNDFYTRLQNGEKLTGFAASYEPMGVHTFVLLNFASSSYMSFEISDTKEEAFTSYSLMYDVTDNKITFLKKAITENSVRMDSLFNSLNDDAMKELTADEVAVISRFIDDGSLNAISVVTEDEASLVLHKQMCMFDSDEQKYVLLFTTMILTFNAMIVFAITPDKTAGQMILQISEIGSGGSDISELEDRVSNMDSQLSDLNVQVTNNERNINDHEDRIGNIENDYATGNWVNTNFAKKTDVKDNILRIDSVAADLLNLYNTAGPKNTSRYMTSEELAFFTEFRARINAGEKISGFLTSINYSGTIISAYFRFNLSTGGLLNFSVTNANYNTQIIVYGMDVDFNHSELTFRKSIAEANDSSGGITQSQLEQHVKTEIDNLKADVLPNYALKTDIPSVPKYYMHTLSITSVATGTACCVTFTVMSKSSATLTVSSLYGLYGSKAFAASGMYGTNVVSKLAFTSSTQARFVYGTGSTAVVAINTISDTVIEVI